MYELAFIATMPLYVGTIYYLCHGFYAERRWSKKTEKITYALFFILQCVTFHLTRIPAVFLALNILGYFLLSLNYEAPFAKRTVCTLLMYSLMFVIEMLTWRLMGFGEIDTFENSEFNSTVGIVINRTSALIFSRLIHRFRKTKQQLYPLPVYYYWVHTLILAGTITLLLFSLEKDNLTVWQVLIGGGILVFVNVLIIFLDENIYKMMQDKYEKEVLTQQNTAYAYQIELIRQSMESTRALKHDMKNHILFLQAAHNNKENTDFEAYVQTLLDTQADVDSCYISSGNFVVDSLINFKMQALRNTEADIQLSANIPPDLAVPSFDLVVIIGNLLDNAITAIQRVQGAKSISLSIQHSRDNLILLLDNTFDGKLIVEDGRYQSRKQEKSEHGIGLSQIQKAVERLDGTLKITHEDDTFSVALVLPLAQ